MSLVFTMPGKIGDAILQWPVAYHHCQQAKRTCRLWLDEGTLKPLVTLFEAQPCVEAVELKPGIEHYQRGGQPFDFGLSTQDHLDHEIYHLGFRRMPMRQITLETLEHVPLHIDRAKVAQEPSLTVSSKPIDRRRVVLHGTFTTHTGGTPGFWKFLNSIHQELSGLFDEILFVGTQAETERALEVYPQWSMFQDAGDFLKLAEVMSQAALVIGAGSSVVTLGGALKVPTIRVHDPIGDYPRVVWSNLGDNQMNETERDLRKLWPAWRDQWLKTPVTT